MPQAGRTCSSRRATLKASGDWRRILVAIEELQRGRREGEQLN